mmetsp:Transcript_32265/g.52212  ORF Transcript_32265/g.52212 Transcript_32265/m.52212 type:complete len:287 (-) Transcript_32265:233-1093(-)
MTQRAQLRHLTALIKEVEIIEDHCAGNKGRSDKKKDVDEFTRNKLELNEVLTGIKDDVKTRKGIEERLGTNSESIKLKNKIKADLETAKHLQQNMEAAYKEDERDVDNGHSDLNPDAIKSRQELVQLMKQDLEFTSNEFEPKAEERGGGQFKVAQQARERRRKKREDGLMSSEPQPLTAKQQSFIQESIQRDQVLDEKLDVILTGVKQLNQIGQDINEELDKQAVMLEEVEQKMDRVQEKLETRNEQIKKLLDASGGASRWCPVLILLVILLACIGYIYRSFIAKG